MNRTAPHVEVRNLCVTVRGPDGGPLRIVDDVSFDVARGEMLALIGESGSGKTTIALSLMGYGRGGARISGDTALPMSRRARRPRSTLRAASSTR